MAMGSQFEGVFVMRLSRKQRVQNCLARKFPKLFGWLGAYGWFMVPGSEQMVLCNCGHAYAPSGHICPYCYKPRSAIV